MFALKDTSSLRPNAQIHQRNRFLLTDPLRFISPYDTYFLNYCAAIFPIYIELLVFGFFYLFPSLVYDFPLVSCKLAQVGTLPLLEDRLGGIRVDFPLLLAKPASTVESIFPTSMKEWQ